MASRVSCNGLQLCGYQDFAKDVGRGWEGVWPCLDPWDSVRLRTASTYWNVPGKYGPHGELLFFLVKSEAVAASNDVPSNPFVSAEMLKAYALIGLHLLAAEGEAGSSGSQSSDSGDVWRYGCPKSPDWNGNVGSESEGTSSSEQCEHNVESLALNVMGQEQSGGKALSCHIALDMLCQEMHEVWSLGCCCQGDLSVTARKAFLSPWTGCDSKERDVVRENKRKG